MHPITAQLSKLSLIESLLAEHAPAATHRKWTQRIARLRKLIPPDSLRDYDRLKLDWKQPVAAVLDGVCQGCQATLTPQAQLKLEQEETVQHCEFCGRFVYPMEASDLKAFQDDILSQLNSIELTAFSASND